MRNKIFWLTGLPCSGKTTIAEELARRIGAEIIDGDDYRQFMENKDFTLEGREKHMLAIAELAYRFSKYTPVVVALVSPIKAVREKIKETFFNVIEIFVNCNINVCKLRDVKGMYKRALDGELKNFTGVDSIYENPESNSTVVFTDILSVEDCVNKILTRHYGQKKHSLFIGRWQCTPAHRGHLALFDEVRKQGKEILIAIRNTGIDENNPYSVEERRESLQMAVPDAKIIVIPDIDEVVYGREVGYGLREIRLSEEIEKISATKIREEVKNE